MLILPRSWREFQANNDRTDTGRTRKKLRREIGFNPTEEVAPGEQREYKGWCLPMNFCADCNRTDITPERGLDGTQRINPGLTEIDEPMPEIDLTVGDVITYYLCHKCVDSENWASANLQGPADKRTYYQARHERRQNNQVEWIKAAKLRGDKPIVGKR